MSMLSQYLGMTSDPVKKELLQQQYHEASNEGSIHCCCGQIRALTMAYRCLYCGLWFCQSCAELHFGLTLQQWIEKKRVEKREELRNKCTLTIDLAGEKCKHFVDEQTISSNRPV